MEVTPFYYRFLLPTHARRREHPGRLRQNLLCVLARNMEALGVERRKRGEKWTTDWLSMTTVLVQYSKSATHVPRLTSHSKRSNLTQNIFLSQ